MTALSVHFAKAVARGRREPRAPDTRERLLVGLLHKRATAKNIGAEELETLLRAQIRWSLPTYVHVDMDDGKPQPGFTF